MTLKEYLDIWLETYVCPCRATNTVKAYRYAFAHFDAPFLETDLQHLDPPTIQRMIYKIAARAPRQAELAFAGLRAALKRAEALRMIDRTPITLCDAPSHEKKEICYLLPDEARRYLEACRQIEGGEILEVMLCLGLRRGEARGLRWQDVDGDILHIRHQRQGDNLVTLKSKASRRDIPIPEGLTIGERGEDDAFLFPYSETELRRRHQKAMELAKIEKKVTLHGLRHTCATLAVISGSQMLTVQHLLGHAHLSTTSDIYCHIDRRELTHTTAAIFVSVSPRLAC